MVVLRNWWAERRVDGVILVNLRAEDPRIPFLEDLAMPAVVIGGPAGTGRLPYSATDDAGGVREMLRYLVAIGHRRIARVAGPGDMMHTVERTQMFGAELEQAGVQGETIETDYTSSAGAWERHRLQHHRLHAGHRPQTGPARHDSADRLLELLPRQHLQLHAVARPASLRLVHLRVPSAGAVLLHGPGRDPGVLAWRGSTDASAYTVLRSQSGPNGPWSTICDRCATDNDTPWTDTSTPTGTVWYKVVPFSPNGMRGPASPVTVAGSGSETLVDPAESWQFTSSHTSNGFLDGTSPARYDGVWPGVPAGGQSFTPELGDVDIYGATG